MKKTCVYIISTLTSLVCIPTIAQEADQPADSVVTIPLKIRAGIEITGPVSYFMDKSLFSLEGLASVDINEKTSFILDAGYSDYSYSQYNYEFRTKGPFFKAGADFNLLRPEMAGGKYWAGGGIHYGLTRFTFETPSLKHENYWGSVSSSLPARSNWGHYLELTGGFRAELFRNFSIGWQVNIRKLIYTGADKDIRPVYYPGYGNSGKTLSYGISYYIAWSIKYKEIRVKIKPEPVEEPEEDETEELPEDSSNLGRQRLGR